MWWWQNFTQINEKKTTLSDGGGCCCYKHDGNVVARHPLPLLLLLLHSYCYTHVPFYLCKQNGDVDVCDNGFPFLFLLLHPSAFLLPLLVLCYWYYMKCGHVELHTNKQKEKPKSPPQSNGGICCCCKWDGDVATCDNVLPLLLVLLLHSCCYTLAPSSSCYYYIAATWDVMMVALLLPHEMWWWLHSCYYTRCNNGITSHKQTKQKKTMLKRGLGVWMGRWVPQGREVGRCKKLGHLEGREKRAPGAKILGPQAWWTWLDSSLWVLIHGWCSDGCWVAEAYII